ncbi:FAD-dependent oxidoreductase [Chloroflexota bacterium]
MIKLEEFGTVIETDVLVIGAGISGLFASVRAKDFVERVTVVDKGPIGHTSQCYFARGSLQGLLPEDDVDLLVKEVVYFEDGLCEQDLVESVYKETFQRINDMERLGVEWVKGKEKRRLVDIGTRGLKYIRRFVPVSDGRMQIESLLREANRLGVQLVSKIFITNILKRDGTAIGAVGFNIVNGEFYIFKAKAVVIATGQCSFKGHYADQGFLTGDGMAIALRAGAELKNLEFATMWLQTAGYPWSGLGFALPLGATMVNAKGEPFMEKYAPVLKSKIDFNYIARAMAIEAKEGRGPFYIDYSPLKPEDIEIYKHRGGWMDLHVRKLQRAGIKPFDGKQELIPVFWTSQGIKTDIEMRTKVPGLFVGGRARSVDPGVTMGSWSIASATVLGYRAGQTAAIHASSCKPFLIDQDEVRRFKSDLYTPLGKVGVEPEEVLLEIQKTVFPYDVTILKHEASLKKALSRITNIRDELLPKMGARDPHYLMELIEMKNMTAIAEGMLTASLTRTESRASHYREDYPNRDDRSWLKWVVVSQENGELNLHTEPLPLDRYKFKPDRYYMDNFKIEKC